MVRIVRSAAIGICWWLFLMVMCLTKAARAESIKCIDALGLAMHNAEVLAQEMDPGMGLGFLLGTFGDPFPKADRVMSSGKIVASRTHLANGTCIRNQVCDKDELRYTDFKKLEVRALVTGRWCDKWRIKDCFINPFLEHDEKDRNIVNQWFKIIRRAAPNAIPVCSAFTGWCPPGVLREAHGFKRGDIVSPDGISHTDIDSAAYREYGRLMTCSWIPPNNGRVSGEKSFIMPKLRKNWPTRDDIRLQVRLLRPPAPRRQGGRALACKDVTKPELTKVAAEYYGVGQDDGRGNKLLFIASAKYPKLTITNLDGQVVGRMSYYGPFDGGGFRHYIGGRFGSNQSPVKLMDDLGSEWGIIKAQNRCWTFNAIRRMGYFKG